MNHLLQRALFGVLFFPIAATASADRPDTPGTSALFHFAEGDTVETHDTARVRVHFTRAGDHAVPLEDANSDGVPDFVENVGAIYEQALEHYTGTGFLPPRSDEAEAENGGDARFDVYLVDFYGSADGSFVREACTEERCTGYMVQENDFAGYGYPSALIGSRIVGSHELFHAIQAAYDEHQGSVYSEGLATWATEHFDGSLFDFERAIGGYFAKADRPLPSEAGGLLDRFAYGSAIFFRFLEERFGVDFLVALAEHTQNGAGGVMDPSWFDALQLLLEDEGTTFADEYITFATWNMLTGARAGGMGYTNAADYPELTTRPIELPFEDERPRHFYAAARYYEGSAGGRREIAAALVNEESVLLVGLENSTGTWRSWGPATELRMPVSERFLIAAINPATEGPSARSTVCIGTPVEVQQCQDRFTDAGPSDAGVGDAGMMPMDAGAFDASVPPLPPEDEGGCSVGSTSQGAPMLAPLVGALFALGRRRRRH